MPIDLLDNAIEDGERTFTLSLSRPINTKIGFSRGVTLTIVDDDAPKYVYLPLVTP
ncbi:MAG: hypothetical protein HC822_11850 [Oscillochloris sp.]|nr:hypothetical protein [Oscillochloris sp.]